MCGKNYPNVTYVDDKRGSPPRVREERNDGPTVATGVRITPACAGRTRSGRQHDRSRQDHPRVCGKNVPVCVYSNFLAGITPACAGRTIYQGKIL